MVTQFDLRNIGDRNPVVELEKELSNIKSGNRIVCIVTNDSTKNIIENMLSKKGYSFKTTFLREDFYIEFINEVKTKDEYRDYVVVIDKLYMGEAEKELGKGLLKSFIYTLCEMNDLPTHVLLYNEGVKLVSDKSELINKFTSLSEKGVEILCCGSCLKYFELVEKIKTGRISNMFEIISVQINASKIIKP
ncbi:sulfurtransferase-like selenium metabolism protein YedF [Mycoplasmatota bacterium]|nr:sulfurtransferase-like selenium metabolism protein YedF [Mycoplasmatota bacterium]